MFHLYNPLATPAQLYSRSTFSSLPIEIQEAIFFSTQCLTQAAGQLLDLPQSTTAQANVILARYWLVDSPMAHEFSDVSAAALYLIAKMGPSPRSPRDLAAVYAYLLSPHSAFLRQRDDPAIKNDPQSYYQSESELFAFQKRVLGLEARILFHLSYDVRVSLPHALAITYLQTLDFVGADKDQISRKTIQHLNAALLSPQMLYLTHQPSSLATAAIYNAAKDMEVKLPGCAWWEVFDVDREELGFLVVGMRSLEGWIRQRKEEMPELLGSKGMPTRRMVEHELRRRGLAPENNSQRSPVQDDEDKLMRSLDEKST